jgi:hypothetical protein
MVGTVKITLETPKGEDQEEMPLVRKNFHCRGSIPRGDPILFG